MWNMICGMNLYYSTINNENDTTHNSHLVWQVDYNFITIFQQSTKLPNEYKGHLSLVNIKKKGTWANSLDTPFCFKDGKTNSCVVL